MRNTAQGDCSRLAQSTSIGRGRCRFLPHNRDAACVSRRAPQLPQILDRHYYPNLSHGSTDPCSYRGPAQRKKREQSLVSSTSMAAHIADCCFLPANAATAGAGTGGHHRLRRASYIVPPLSPLPPPSDEVRIYFIHVLFLSHVEVSTLRVDHHEPTTPISFYLILLLCL